VNRFHPKVHARPGSGWVIILGIGSSKSISRRPGGSRQDQLLLLIGRSHFLIKVSQLGIILRSRIVNRRRTFKTELKRMSAILAQFPGRGQPISQKLAHKSAQRSHCSLAAQRSVKGRVSVK
jgi:hypothetical protein